MNDQKSCETRYKKLTLTESFIKTFISFGFLFVVLGVAYPYAVTYTSDMFFKDNAEGSLIKNDEGKVIGSKLIGQDFSFDKTLFQSRPSSSNYDAQASGGSNLSVGNEKQIKAINERKDAILNLYHNPQKIPTDMLTASGSGLDPHISAENAYYQVPYIASARGIKIYDLYNLIEKHSTDYMLSDRAYVNVLELNLDLQKLNKE